ncbi:MAG TPA: hypothetical protein VH835_10285 [Dongiaceae bacterium]
MSFRRLPYSFGSLVRRYAFIPFEWGPLSFLGNSGTDDEHDFPAAVLDDRLMWKSMLDAGFVQFARPAGGSYDAICFDARSPQHNGEFSILRLDHESVLGKQRIGISKKIAQSFLALVESLLASGGEPSV